MPIPKAVARFNRYVTNPVARRVAGWVPGFGILRHRGRRTGNVYSTPLNVFEVDDGFVIALTYGPEVDWRKNVFSAGECFIVHRGRELRLVEPRFISTAEGMSHMPPPVGAILRLIGVTEFVHLQKARR